MKMNRNNADYFYRNKVTMVVSILGVLTALLLLGIVLVQGTGAIGIVAAIVMLLVCGDATAKCIAVRKK